MNDKQSGSTTVEFALATLAFLVFVLGMLDFARMLFTWNAATEATRAGARYAVVCADRSSNTRILSAMQGVLPQVASIDVVWEPADCNTGTCEAVTVSITALKFQWLAPLPGALGQPLIMMPGFSTYLPREMMTYDARIC